VRGGRWHRREARGERCAWKMCVPQTRPRVRVAVRHAAFAPPPRPWCGAVAALLLVRARGFICANASHGRLRPPCHWEWSGHGEKGGGKTRKREGRQLMPGLGQWVRGQALALSTYCPSMPREVQYGVCAGDYLCVPQLYRSNFEGTRSAGACVECVRRQPRAFEKHTTWREVKRQCAVKR